MSSPRIADTLLPLQDSAIHYSIALDDLAIYFNSNTDLITKRASELLEIVKSCPDQVEAYVKLKEKIRAFEALPPSKKTDRQLLLLEIDALFENVYQFILNHDLLRLEFLNKAKPIFSHINGDLKWLEYFSRLYFQEMLASENKTITKFEFFPKLDGDQLGRRARIQYSVGEDKKEIFYFIKTHQEGSRRNEKNARPADPKELFFYKLLELTGLGPKVHFYLNPLVVGSYFIATQDESFTKSANKHKFFKTYGQLRGELEEKPENSFKESAVFFHLLEKLFHLWDLITNPGNFGKVTINEADRYHQKWRIIDFRTTSLEQYENINILNNYLTQAETAEHLDPVKSFINNLAENDKINIAKQAINILQTGRLSHSKNTHKLPLNEAIFTAFCYIARLLQKQAALGCLGFTLNEKLGHLANKTLATLSNNEIIQEFNQLQPSERGDLGNYVIAASKNLKELSDEIEKYSAKSDSEITNANNDRRLSA